jgi:hypothetical protein
MDVRQTRPAEAGQPSPQPVAAQRSHGSRPRGAHVVWILAVLALVGILGSMIYMGAQSLMADQAVKSNEYQAVFLTNNQVYFGHLTQVNGGYVKLTNIYYLQVQQSVQPDAKTKDTNQQNQISLAKLGSELHGPEDIMYISRDQVLFWENLKTDGKVAQAIADYSKKK